LLLLAGFVWQRRQGSHHVFRRESVTIVVPERRPHVRAPYVRRVLELTREEPDDD
jgi:predicted RNA binding protein YcfA (HicA-like mRNA interferase family)